MSIGVSDLIHLMLDLSSRAHLQMDSFRLFRDIFDSGFIYFIRAQHCHLEGDCQFH